MEPVFHYIIPVLLLLGIFPKFCKKTGYKKVLLLGLLGFLPDLDSFTNFHRIWLHNIFFAIILFLIIYFLAGKIYGLLSIYFLGSHLLFDLNRFGAALLWPFYKMFMGFEIGVLKIENEGFKLIFDFFIEPFSVSEGVGQSWYLNPMGTLVTALIGILILIKFVQIKRHKI